MKSFVATATSLMLLASPASAFSPASSFSGSQLSVSQTNSATITMEYIPSGMSKAQWEKQKLAEKNKTNGKNLGANGITTFKSQSFSEWQKRGGINLFPVDPNKVKDPKDIPYMQRPGGMPDNSDLKKKGGGGGGGMFSFGKKKKEAAVAPKAKAPVSEKKTNWWTL